jgi:hypothetical protein
MEVGSLPASSLDSLEKSVPAISSLGIAVAESGSSRSHGPSVIKISPLFLDLDNS